jgi:hypothetical protein
MYEFLAPWGVLAPAISATIVYVCVSEIRRKRQLLMIEAASSPAGGAPLSQVHG